MDGAGSRTLAEHTTLRVGGPAAQWRIATTAEQACEVVRHSDEAGTPLLILGGGSNLLVSDAGFAGLVLQIAIRGQEVVRQTEDSVDLRVGAGEVWDDLVASAVARGWGGIEALSGIPGLVGATPVQNVGAYGQDIAQVLVSVEAWDRSVGEVVELPAAECGFGYRTSRFKAEPDRWVILAIVLRLSTAGWGQVSYPELAAALGVGEGEVAPVASVRGAVLILRSGKGMVLDSSDTDTWSAGSFFTNPIVTPEQARALSEDCPRYPAVGGVKLSAAWLISQAGIERGFGVRAEASARVSTKHSLALTNRGDASAEDILELARVIRSRVVDAFGIELQPEPRLVNCSL